MLMVAILWAISSPFDKVGVVASTPLTYLSSMLFVLIILQSLAVFSNRESREGLTMVTPKNWTVYGDPQKLDSTLR